jgi:DNA-binding transcriptional MerR regulator
MKIGTLAKRSGLSADTLRYYEKVGLLPRAERDPGGRRAYCAEDLPWIEFLQKLKATAMPMRRRIDYARLRAQGPTTAHERRKILEEHQADLFRRREEINACLVLLDEKIGTYRQMEADRG